MSHGRLCVLKTCSQEEKCPPQHSIEVLPTKPWLFPDHEEDLSSGTTPCLDGQNGYVLPFERRALNLVSLCLGHFHLPKHPRDALLPWLSFYDCLDGSISLSRKQEDWESLLYLQTKRCKFCVNECKWVQLTRHKLYKTAYSIIFKHLNISVQTLKFLPRLLLHRIIISQLQLGLAVPEYVSLSTLIRKTLYTNLTTFETKYLTFDMYLTNHRFSSLKFI